VDVQMHRDHGSRSALSGQEAISPASVKLPHVDALRTYAEETQNSFQRGDVAMVGLWQGPTTQIGNAYGNL